MRVGFISHLNPHDPAVMSGLIHGAWRALVDAGIELVDLGPGDAAAAPTVRNPAGGPTVRQRLGSVRRRAQRLFSRPWEYRRTLAQAARASLAAQARLDRAPPLDALFTVSMNIVLYRLQTPLPIVYASDTTARLMNTTYDDFAGRSHGFHRACDAIERAALHKCAFFAASSRVTAHSAITDYGMAPGQVRVVEFGAHITPGAAGIDPQPPSRGDLQLVLVAADPVRKQLPLCIAVARCLRERGWNCRLHYVGPHHPAIDGDPAVAWAGRLNLGDPADREQHRTLLRQSHWLLLPSLAEAFGIAPCEAAHFGRPSCVSDAGGLPTVVHHGVTGIVLPRSATAEAYADAIAEASSDPARYAALSAAAMHRAQTVLSWPVWGRRIRDLIEEAVAAPR